MKLSQTYKVSRAFRREDTIVEIGGVVVGAVQICVIAGPCSVESREQLLTVAHAVKQSGATMLRGGAFKPRTSPYAFQGLGEAGLRLLREAREQVDLPIVTEVMSCEQIALVAAYADVLQIGARNMQNYPLLHAVSDARKPILLKRGAGNTLHELLMAAEHILSRGNTQVILCERGIRTFETATRYTFDINAIPVLKELTHLPVIADPSHGVGQTQHVPSIAKSAIAASADGIIVEVHDNPNDALSDGAQSLTPTMFNRLMVDLERVVAAVDRTLSPAYEPAATL
jgi:3-deoxy-7-phosphoheptulonate synthase